MVAQRVAKERVKIPKAKAKSVMMLNAMFDRRLYSKFILVRVFFLGFGTVIPAFAFYLTNLPGLISYEAAFFVVILFSGLFSKKQVIKQWSCINDN